METRVSAINPTLLVVTLSKTRGEVIPAYHNPQHELQVYTRKKFHKVTTIPVIPSADVQLALPNNDPTTQSNLPSTSIPSDLDLPIALRKEIQTCTKHLIAQYL